MYMSEEDEKKIYHIFCDISKVCRDYFWCRLHIPNDGWSIDGEVNEMIDSLEYLRQTHKELRAKYPEEEEVWDTDQMSE